MKTKLLLLMLLPVVLLIGCDDSDDDPTGSGGEWGKDVFLYGYWEETSEDAWNATPISFNAEHCLFVDENGITELNWHTSITDTLRLSSLDEEAADQPHIFEYSIVDGELHLISNDDEEMVFVRPSAERTVVDSMEIPFDIASGLADLVLTRPGEIIEVLVEEAGAGHHNYVWYPDESLENGTYALDIYRTINENIYTTCRQYVMLNR